MSKRRTHSTIDTLPAEIREAITAMIVDAVWPEDFPAPPDYSGKPRYEDVVTYCQLQGQPVSSSAVGRWAKSLLVLELMQSKAVTVRGVMKNLTAENASATQKAVAEIITAKLIDFALEHDLSAKEFNNIARAVKDCTAVSISADKYVREQIKEKAAKADKAISKLVKKKKIDPQVLKQIREEIYGIIK